MKRFIEIIFKPRLNYFDAVCIGIILGQIRTGGYITAGITFIVAIIFSASVEVWIAQQQKQGETQ